MQELCAECGMLVAPNELHPYAACLMFKACGNSKTVKANLDAMTHDRDWRIAELEAEVERLQGQLDAIRDLEKSEWGEWEDKPRGVEAYPKHRGENHLRKELDSYKGQEGE